MVRKLPPLNALKAFEAAARHESLTRAASELNVTHAAISRHIRGLELAMRVTLFERTGRGVVLTEAGSALSRDLTKAFDLLANATARFSRPTRRRQRLAISSDLPFATYWLVPRLGRFTSTHPNIDLVLDPSHRVVDLSKEDFDLAIRYGGGNWRGVEAEKLSDANLTVVCSPRLVKGRKFKAPSELPAEEMIQEQDRAFWRIWLDAAGAAPKLVPSGPTLLADLTISAAIAGQGFALADRVLAADAVLSTQLVAPFELSIACNGYYLVNAAGKPPSKPLADFRRWIKDEMAETLVALKSHEQEKSRPRSGRG